MKRRLKLPIDSIIRFYTVKMWSLEKIAGCFNCSEPTIRQRLISAGVTVRQSNDTKRGAPSPRRLKLDRSAVVAAYIASDNVSVAEVARAFRCNESVIARLLREAGVVIRPLSAVIRGKRTGSANSNWRDDLTPEERATRRDMSAQAKWRVQVYERDGFSCVKCGDDTGGNLNAHHIENHSSNRVRRWDVDNGVTFCEPCHRAFHKRFGYQTNNPGQLAEFLMPVLTATPAYVDFLHMP